LLKGGSALERLAAVRAIAFDKTGTLTEGKLELGEVVGIGGVPVDEVLTVAATAEQRSEHPLARLILHEAAARKLSLGSVEDFRAQPGAGVVTQSGTIAIVVGTPRLLAEQSILIPAEAQAALERLDAAGQTPLLVARGEIVVGVIGARDRIRAEAGDVLAQLRKLGVTDIALLTGDRKAVAQSIATQLDIHEVHAELLPADKAAFLERWRKEHTQAKPEGESSSPQGESLLGAILSPSTDSPRRVAMVGDGINDAPALAVADVGLAIGGTGSDIAAEAGDVVFMGDPLRSLPLLVELSRETVRIIRQNILVFAFAVNLVGIVVTAWLWPLFTPRDWHTEAPLAAVIYHQFGSLAVLVNSMRLLWFGRSQESATLKKAKSAFENADRWIATYLDPHEISHWLIDHAKSVAAIVLLLVLGGYALSGVIAVRPDEVAVVRRFGKPLPKDFGPGLHWCWPWPIDEVVRLQADRVKSLTIGFQAVPGTAEVGTWDASHQGAIKLAPEEAVLITGDGNLIELLATVRYRVDRPHTYLFEVQNPEEILRATAEGVLREAVAGRPFVDLLTAERGRIQEDVRRRLEQRCGEYGSDGLGLHIDGVSLLDLHPPQEVVGAYHEVTKAMEQRDTVRNKAEEQALRKVKASESDRSRAIHLAEAERTETRRLAEAQSAYFLSRLRARRTLSVGDEVQLVLAAGEEMERGRNSAEVLADYRRHRKERLEVNARLVEFRAFWDALGRVLNNREKIILDADKVPGRRQLMLFDPERFRVPVPMLPPSRRSGETHEGP
jgi:Cu+-exporting ATPase